MTVPTTNTVETTFHVRYAETDAMGIVHHANYLVWFEESRSALMRANNTSYAAFEADGVALAVTQANLRYITPAVYDQPVTIKCTLKTIQSRKMVFTYSVLNSVTGQTLATGETHHICINRDGSVARIPLQWRELFQTE